MVAPFQVLRILRLDRFTGDGFDVWVLRTLFSTIEISIINRLQDENSQQLSLPLQGHSQFSGLATLLLIQSCDPNASFGSRRSVSTSIEHHVVRKEGRRALRLLYFSEGGGGRGWSYLAIWLGADECKCSKCEEDKEEDCEEDSKEVAR